MNLRNAILRKIHTALVTWKVNPQMRNLILFFLVLISLTVFGSTVFDVHGVQAVEKNRHSEQGFRESSLKGSYASGGRAGGSLSRSVGVTTFDGRGNVTRYVKINSSDGMGGRKFLELTSVGTYTIEPDGLGVIHVTNFYDNPAIEPRDVTYDFVVRKSSKSRGKKGLLADEIDAIQQEAGVTAELVEESFSRRDGLQ